MEVIRLEINIERLQRDIEDLGKIGFEENIGVTRLAYSTEYDKGVDLVKKLMESAGMKTCIDPVGNLIGRLEGEGDKAISIGSHIDSVPAGGIYDGTLGVLAGIECIRVLQENGYKNHCPIEVIAFIEEEGNVIGGTFGSKCFTGTPIEDSSIPKMKQHGLDMNSVNQSRRDSEKYKCYLELHIEQGGILDNSKTSIGVVNGIVGITRYKATVKGMANHAGSTPMNLRDDALTKTCKMITRLMEIAHLKDEEITCTVGQMTVLPGAVNVIPGEVEFVIELRGKSIADNEEIIEQFNEEFKNQGMFLKNILSQKETVLDEKIINVVQNCCEKMNISYREMYSGAGHDAINMALFTPSAMIFIPSIGGISHSIVEKSSSKDIATGCQLLLNTIIELDK